MNDSYTHESFGRDVDRILEAAGRKGGAAPDTDDRDDLVLAAELASIDFSDESRVRAPLRRKLLSGEGAASAWSLGPRLAAAVAAAAVIVTALFIQPDLRAAIVQPTLNFIKQLVLGERTQAVLVDQPVGAELEAILAEQARGLEAGERWSVRTASGSQGGDVPEGASPVIRTYNSLRLAEENIDFPVRKPDWFPGPYRFDSAVLTPAGGVVLWYRAPGRRLTLAQKPTRLGGTTMVMGMGDGATLENVEFGEIRAAWVNGESLVWENGGMTYDLEATELTLEQAKRVAASLR
jgi:hypothetical protein